MTEHITIRPAQPQDRRQALDLLPQLADFDVPSRRNPKHLWEGDADLFEQTLAGQARESFADVAVHDDGRLVGLILVTMRAEMLSHAPSAHLEAIVVAPEARGSGLGKRLLGHAERRAYALGAGSMTLHVFANNHRARTLYDSSGYDSEMIRAIKWLE